MRKFQAWAKANNLHFKHRKNEQAAFETWKLCQAEKDALTHEIKAVTELLNGMRADIDNMKAAE